MSVIRSSLDTRGAEFARNAEAMRGARRRPARRASPRSSRAAARRRASGTSARGKLLPRERVAGAARPRLALPRAVASSPRTGCTATRSRPPASSPASAGSPGRECVIVANDATVKGGTYYPMTVKKHLRAQEIARAEPPALHLPGRYRRRQPAEPGRGLPRPRPFRPHLLQPGHHVGRRHPADRRRHGLLHGRRRLCAGDVATRAIIVRNQGTIFLGGPPLVKAATGEVVTAEDLGGADVHTPHLRRRRPLRARTTRTRSASRAGSSADLNRAKRLDVDAPRARASRAYDPAELYGIVPADPRKPYDVREVIARIVDGSRARRVQAALRHHAGLAASPISTAIPVGILANNGILFSRIGAEGRAFHRAVLPARHPAALPAEHHRLHGRPEIRGRRHRQGRRQDGDGRRQRRGAEVHGHHRRQLRRRQLRHVRPRLSPALPVDVAERPHLGHGRRAGGRACWRRCAATASRRAARRGRPRRRRRSRRRSATQYETQGHPYYATARLWDDGIIDPGDTRTVLAPRPLGGAQRPGRAHAASACSGCDAMFRTLLIANRGEIACRVIRTARRMGIAHGRRLLRRRRATRCTSRWPTRPYPIGPAPARESYLNGRRASSRRPGARGADAIHPGYGFLSENAAFAEACAAAGSSSSARRPPRSAPWAARATAKALMERGRRAARARLPRRRPGRRRSSRARPSAIGYPVLIKASAGGGGKGMRVVDRGRRLRRAQLAGAKREAAAAFGDDRVLLERYLTRPRHVEIQVFADSARQLRPPVRARLLDPAPPPEGDRGGAGARPRPGAAPPHGRGRGRGGRAVGYVGAGTVEFIARRGRRASTSWR